MVRCLSAVFTSNAIIRNAVLVQSPKLIYLYESDITNGIACSCFSGNMMSVVMLGSWLGFDMACTAGAGAA